MPLEPVPQVLQVVPAAATLIPGQAVNFRVRLIDASGRLIREEGAQPPRQTSIPGQGALQSKQPSPARDLQWSLDALVGVVQADGRYVVPGDARAQAGRVMVRRGPLIGESRIRVVPPHWQVTFEGSPPGAVPSWWVGAHDRFTVKAVDGVNVLASLPGGLSAPAQVARGFSGPHRATNYTMEADIRLTGGSALGEGAVLAQGYELAVAGSRQQLELRSWTPEAGRTKTAAMPLTAGTWVRVKLRVELMLDGGVLAQGKAWPKDAPEPAAWSVERRDPPGFGLLIGSPGIASSGPSEVHFNNLRVFPN